MEWRAILAVAAGGAVGSVARFVVSTIVAQRFGAGFPVATLGINVLGSFLIGVVAEWSLTGAYGVSPMIRLLIAVGVLGGFTTFSSFSLETLQLVRDGAPLLAFGYAAGSVLLGLAAAFAGLTAARAMVP